MARQFWVVLADDKALYEEQEERGRLTLRNNNTFGIFFNKERAEVYAQQVSKSNPGTEVQVAQSLVGYHSPPPTKITQKVWNEAGEYVLP